MNPTYIDPVAIAHECGIGSPSVTDRDIGSGGSDSGFSVFAGDTDTTSLHDVREWVCGEIEHLPVQSMDLLLAGCELVTNVKRHAAGPFEVGLLVCDEGVLMAVSDTHPVELPVPRDPKVTDVAGRGMRIVEKLADRWGVIVHDDSKSVWAMFPFDLEFDSQFETA